MIGTQRLAQLGQRVGQRQLFQRDMHGLFGHQVRDGLGQHGVGVLAQAGGAWLFALVGATDQGAGKLEQSRAEACAALEVLMKATELAGTVLGAA